MLQKTMTVESHATMKAVFLSIPWDCCFRFLAKGIKSAPCTSGNIHPSYMTVKSYSKFARYVCKFYIFKCVFLSEFAYIYIIFII